MRCVVTGVAGFIGSHLAERLVADGHDVVGIDRYTDYYPRATKENNVARLRQSSRFELIEDDLTTMDLRPVLEGASVVFHQAAQPGVRASWGSTFTSYVSDNVLATQRLLEAAKASGTRKVVAASSSSVYGQTDDLPMRETSLPRPYSPYGVTKLAAEHLCELYRTNFGVPTVSLRYFTVYGPRQRPDMGFHRFIGAVLRDRPIRVFGDGKQTRDFTFVADAVEANLLSANDDKVGVFNIGGGSRATLLEVLATLGEVAGRPVRIEHQGDEPGDVRHTWADTTRARQVLGFSPGRALRDGLAAQFDWQKSALGG
jgi:nucleoside-diphosphate-sugar epimerase